MHTFTKHLNRPFDSVFMNTMAQTMESVSQSIQNCVFAYCQSDECYFLMNRSSGPKKGFSMANSIGLIDSDYYGNEDNDGHFYFAYFNCSDHDIEVKKGDVIGQVVFTKYLVVDNDNATGVRKGGFGSTENK